MADKIPLSPGELNDILNYDPDNQAAAAEMPSSEIEEILAYDPDKPAEAPAPKIAPSVSPAEIEEILAYDPDKSAETPTEKSSEVEEILAYDPDKPAKKPPPVLESGAAREVAGIALSEKHARDLKRDIEVAEEKRKQLLESIANNERIVIATQKMKDAGASNAEVEAYKEQAGWTAPSFFGALGETIAHLGKTESSFPLDVKVALEGRSDAFSPLTGIGSIVQNAMEKIKGKKRSGITWTDRNVTERVKELLSKPIIDKYGIISPEAVAVSDLPRYQQNELLLEHAQRKTGISKEVWRGILGSRGGVMEDDSAIGTVAKRVARIADEVAFNIPSSRLVKGGPGKNLEVLKELPTIPIPIHIQWDGDTAYANGVEVPDAHPGDSPAQVEREGWKAIIDNQKGQVEMQAMENWQSVASMLVPAGGVVKGAGKLIGTGAKAASLASRTGKVLEALGKPGQLVEGAVKSTLRVAPSVTLRLAELEKTAPAVAKGLQVSGHLATKVLTPAALAAVGAPEGQGQAAFVGGALMGGTFSLIEPAMASFYRSRDPIRAILRTPEYEKLPSFVKKYVDTHLPKGVDYKEFRDANLNQVELSNTVKTTILKIQAGQLPAETMGVVMEQIAESPKARGFLDLLSQAGDPNGLTPVGRWQKRMAEKLADENRARAAVKQSSIPAQSTPEYIKSMNDNVAASNRMRESLKTIPNQVFNDRDSFIKVLRGEEVDGFKMGGAQYLADSLEGVLTTEATNYPYRLFAQDVLKMSAAAADASSPRKLADLMELISNKPEMGAHFQAIEKMGREQDTTIFGTKLNAVAPEASVSKLMSGPGAQEIKNIVNLAVEDIGLYATLKGKKSGVGIQSHDIRIARMLQEERIRQYRFKSSLDKEQLANEVLSLNKAKEALDDTLYTRETRQARGGTAFADSKLDKLKMYLSDPSFPESGKRQLAYLIEKADKGGVITNAEMSFLPAGLQPALRDVSYVANRSQELRAGIQEGLLRHGSIDEKVVKSRALNLQKEVLYNNPTSSAAYALADMEERLIGKTPVPGLTDSKYFRNVVGMVSQEIGDSIEKTGSVTISPDSIGYLRLMGNMKFAKEVIGFNGFNNKEYARFRTRLSEEANVLFSFSTDGKMWKDGIDKLNAQLKDTKANIPGITRQLKYMRQAFQVSKMQRDLDKYAYKLYDVAERSLGGEQLSKADVRNLVNFMTSSVVQRYRLAKDPSWIVTRTEEAAGVFDLIKNTTPQLLEEMRDVFGRTLNRNRNDLNDTVVASWFVTAQNDYDKSGYLGAALQLASYYRKGTGSPRYTEYLANLANQELAATVISKDTGYAIAADVSAMSSGKQRGKLKADKIVDTFFKEAGDLKVGNKKYIDFQGSEQFRHMVQKSIIGLKGIEGRLVMNGVETELGGIFRKWVKQGQTEDGLVRIMEEWKRGVSSPDVDNQAARMEGSLRSYWRVQGLTPETHEMGIKYIQLWQKHDKLKLEMWNAENAIINQRTGSRVAPLEYQPARLETDASITSTITFDKRNMDNLVSMDVMFGRHIATNEAGQNMKAQMNTSLKDLMHPDELFHQATHSMFQDLLAREPRRRLWEKGLLMENAGYGAYATSVSQSFLGAIPAWNFDTMRVLNSVINTVPILREAKALSPLINANYYLVSYAQAGMNFIQNAQLQALNPYAAKDAFMGLVRSGPGFMKGMVLNAIRSEDVVEAAALAGRSPSPRYTQLNAELMRGLNPAQSAMFQSKLARVDWDASPMWKKIHAGASRISDPIFERINVMIKENSEAVTYRIVLGQAANLWESGLAAARAVSDQGEGAMFRAARDVLEKPLSGVTGSRMDTADIAMSLVKELGTDSMSAYERFALTYAHQSVGRYDPGNVPALVRNLGRIVPGFSQFYNPTSAGVYRLLAAGHGLVTRGGRDAGHVGIAVATVAGLYGLSSMWLALSQTTGIETFNKLIPLAGFMTVAGEPGQEGRTLLDGGGTRVGGMQQRIMVDLLMRSASLAKAHMQAGKDGTQDTAAIAQKTLDAETRLLDIALQTGPWFFPAALRDILWSPAKVGMAYLHGDDQQLYKELVAMEAKDEFELHTMPENTPMGGERNSFMAMMFNMLVALTPNPDSYGNLYPFTADNVLEYLAKEKAIPLSFLYQIRETRRKGAQHKQDLQDTLMTGEGVGEYTPDPSYNIEPEQLPEEEEEKPPETVEPEY